MALSSADGTLPSFAAVHPLARSIGYLRVVDGVGLAHPQDVAETLVKLHDAGKIRAAGVSNYSVRQTTVLQSFERLGEARRALEVRLTRDDWYAVLTASRQERLP